MFGPELYLQVRAADGNKDGPAHTYRKRTIQDVKYNVNAGYEVKPTPRASGVPWEAWQVVHIAPQTVNAIAFEVRLLDVDLLIDDEYRLNPDGDGKDDGLKFTVTGLDTGGKLAEDSVTTKLKSSTANLAVVTDKTPTLFTATGVQKSNWPFAPDPATIEFSITVARAES